MQESLLHHIIKFLLMAMVHDEAVMDREAGNVELGEMEKHPLSYVRVYALETDTFSCAKEGFDWSHGFPSLLT